MIKDLTDWILIVEDVLTSEQCDQIVNEYDEGEWVQTETAGGIDRNIRSASTVVISFPEVIGKNPEVRKQIDDNVWNASGKCINAYNEHLDTRHFHIVEDTGYELLRYKVGEHYSEHVDHFKGSPRTVSCSFALNDNYEGGEFGFWENKHKVRVPKGSAIMFPANFLYPHQIIPVTKGERFSIVTWFR